MRYGYMVHRYQPASESASRKFVLSKQATTAALDFRRLIYSIRGQRVVLVLITFPFLFALLRAGNRRSQQAKAVTHVPEVFDKYGYEAIRMDRDVPIPESDVATQIDMGDYLKALKNRRQFQVDPRQGVTVIAACRDRTHSLSLALPVWDSVEGLKEIVLVDWGSDESILENISAVETMVSSGKLTFIRVRATNWVLGRAYNLAAKFATGGVLLKLDCDTSVDKSFLRTHSLRKGTFYTVHWGSERAENERSLRGIWMARKKDFWNVGGYDERIVGYGYEDVDLYARWAEMGLQSDQIDLDRIRHTVAGHLLWAEEEEGARKVSSRMNEAVLKKSPSWRQEFDKGHTMQFEFSYSEKTHALNANITNEAVDPLQEMTENERTALRVDVLQKALHDEYNIPWDILPSLPLGDLEYLAGYLDSGSEGHVLVVSFDGGDALSNLFNLVSAINLGMTIARPVIAIWNGPNGVTLNQTSEGSLIEQLFDLAATNALLEQVPESTVAKRNGLTKATRLIGAEQWPCVEELQVCADKYDEAFAAFSKLETLTPRIYDEEEPMPISVRKHAFLRLSNETVIGNEETRALAFKALVESPLVREEETKFSEKPEIGIIAEGADSSVARLARHMKRNFDKALSPGAGGMMPIVGSKHLALRKELSNEQVGGVESFCDEGHCTIEEIAREVANVMALCKAVTVYPEVSSPTKDTWSSRKNVGSMMIAELRALQQRQ
eukprot:GFKZ01006005.1.p1 GENE.GFKZ01006005.1~~GFKZ01006005.1.p1  ORF type:complete len:724 (+),score=90.66 GFKZ01006005.1:135-2306(+)